MDKRMIILCGIPTSGKSTWTEKFISNYPGAKSVSRDEIRERLFGKDYKIDKHDEKFVTIVFDKTVRTFLDNESTFVILDNTHCRESYITQAIEKYTNEGCEVWIKFFDIPMWKAYYRNIKRYLGTGKWIPIKVLQDMRLNYNKINKNKYHEKHMVFK